MSTKLATAQTGNEAASYVRTMASYRDFQTSFAFVGTRLKKHFMRLVFLPNAADQEIGSGIPHRLLL